MEVFGGHIIQLEKSDEKGMLNADQIKNYLDKASKATCKIIISKNIFGSGFFCLIPYLEKSNSLLHALITCYHVLDNILNENKIEIIINEEHKFISLEQRKFWINKELDFVCIEIKEKQDGINSFYFIDNNNFDNNYLNEKALIFGINKNDKKLGFSNGIIKSNKEPFFEYTCNTTPGCSGGCIVKESNNRVIGIHQGGIVKKKEWQLNQGIYIINIIKSIKKDNTNYIKNLEQILNSLDNGNDILNILINDCSFFKINPENLKMDDKVLKLLFNVSRNKLNNDLKKQLEEILYKVRYDINTKTPKELREFNPDNYYIEKLTEFNELFNNICEEDFHQLQCYLRTVIQDVKNQLTSSFEESIISIIQNKYNNTIIYPKNVQELLREQNISNLIKGREYVLYFNFKGYKVVALGDNKVALPGLTVLRLKIRDEENGGIKDLIIDSTDIKTYFDPDSMEIRLSDNEIKYWKGSHTGCLRGHFQSYRNTYIDDYFYRMIISLPENFEFDVLEGNNLYFDKYSYSDLVINVNYNQTLKGIKIGQSGNTVIRKISVKPKL